MGRTLCYGGRGADFSSVETVTGDFSAKLQPLLGPLRL